MKRSPLRRTPMRRRPDVDEYRRIFLESRFDRGPDCWRWIGPVAANGYGTANLVDARTTAHRAVYELLIGPVPPGMHLDHRCHNEDLACPGGPCLHRRCVNPAHLVLATPGENVSRGKTIIASNLAKTECPYGHPYTHVDSRGWRKCRQCTRVRSQVRRRSTAGRAA